MDVRLERRGDGIVLEVRAAPGASRDRVVGPHGGAVKVAVTAAPERGRANERLLAVLAAALGLPSRSLELIAGATSRDKRVLVRGIAPDDLRARLAACFP